MKTCTLLLLFFCLCPNISYSQLRGINIDPDEEIKWLQNHFLTSKTFKRRVEVYLGLSQVYSKINKPDIAFSYLEKALECSDSTENNESKYKARFYIAIEYAKRGNFKEAYNKMSTAFELSLLNEKNYIDAENAKKLLLEYCKPAGYSTKDYNKLEEELSGRLRLRKAYINIENGLRKANSLIESGEINSAILLLKRSVAEADLIRKYHLQYKTRIKLSEAYVLREYHTEAINTLDEAFYLSLNNKERKDAENAVELLRKYYQLKGESEYAIVIISKFLLSDLEVKFKEIKTNKLISDEEKTKWLEELYGIKEMIGDTTIYSSEIDNGNETKVYYDSLKEYDRITLSQKVFISLLLIALLIIFWKYYVERKNSKKLSKQFEIMKLISKLENTDEISNKIISKSIELFNFDYATISIVDFFKHRISIQYLDTKNKEKVNPTNWMSDANFDLNEDDVLCLVVREKKVKTYIGRKTKLGIYPELNEKIVWENNQKNLNRIFVPIVHSKFINFNGDNESKVSPVISVLEAGFRETLSSRLLRNSKITRKIKSNYSFFVEVSTSGFYKAFEKQAGESINKLVEKNALIENHQEYISSVLKDVIDLFNVEIGEISFLNFDDLRKKGEVIYRTKEGIGDNRFELPNKKDIIRKGFDWHVIETGKHYFSNDLGEDPYYYQLNVNTLSELTVPFIYEDQVIGVINLESFKSDYFNPLKLDLIEKIVKRIIPVYMKKKLDIMLRSVLKQFNNFTNIDYTYDLIVNIVSEYIKSDYVSLWELRIVDRPDNKTHCFIPKHSTNKLKENLKNNGNVKSENFSNEGFSHSIILDLNRNNSNFEYIKEYFTELGLSSVVIVPIVIEDRLFSFISIASKSDLIHLFHEDEVFLSQIASKASSVLKYAKLFNEFSNIGKSLSKSDKKNTIVSILKCAKDVLNSDLVTLIRYEFETKIFMNDIEYYGSFVNNDRFLKNISNNGLEDTYLIDKILGADEIIFRNSGEYEAFIKDRPTYQSSVFEASFWYRENIKSMAAITLKFDNEPLGIIFFNYRSELKFSEDFRLIMRTFASLASTSLANAKHLEIINLQRKRLEKKAAKLQFEYEEVFNQMKEMVPLAARTSFYIILEGMNHDIRNIMIRMKQMTVSIKQDYDRLTQKTRVKIEKRILDLNKGMSLISTLLAIFNFKKFKLEYIDTSEIIIELTNYFINRADYNVKFNIDELKINDLLYCYKAEFSMIFYNLFNNSIFAIKEKGCEEGLIKVTSFFEENEFIIIVEDNGIGIDNQDINKIYDAGFTKKEGGLGIGLFFVKQCLTESFNGEISCESKYRHFTRFTIKIPKNID